MLETLVGIVFLLLSAYTFYNTYHAFSFVKNKGNAQTSHFIMLSLWSSAVFGWALLAAGLSILLHWI